MGNSQFSAGAACAEGRCALCSSGLLRSDQWIQCAAWRDTRCPQCHLNESNVCEVKLAPITDAISPFNDTLSSQSTTECPASSNPSSAWSFASTCPTGNGSYDSAQVRVSPREEKERPDSEFEDVHVPPSKFKKFWRNKPCKPSNVAKTKLKALIALSRPIGGLGTLLDGQSQDHSHEQLQPQSRSQAVSNAVTATPSAHSPSELSISDDERSLSSEKRQTKAQEAAQTLLNAVGGPPGPNGPKYDKDDRSARKGTLVDLSAAMWHGGSRPSVTMQGRGSYVAAADKNQSQTDHMMAAKAPNSLKNPAASSSEQRPQSSLVQLRVTDLGGNAVEVQVAATESIEGVRQQLSLLRKSTSFKEARFICDGQMLGDKEVVADLPATELQLVLKKQTVVESLGPELEGEFKYTAPGVLADNGKIYFAPFDGACQVLCVDPATQSVEQLGPELRGCDRYSAPGVVAPNGKIYFAPRGAPQVLCIDPISHCVQTIGPEIEGSSKYTAPGVLAPNGKIYFAPRKAQQVLSIDPETHTVELLGPEMEGDFKYTAPGVLTAGGKIFFAPSFALQVLCIDTAKLDGNGDAKVEVELWGQNLEGNHKYTASGVLAPNGKLYFAPNCAQKVLCVDPAAPKMALPCTRVELLGGPDLGDADKYTAPGILSATGKIYFAPFRGASQVASIFPENQSIQKIGPTLKSSEYFAPGVVAANGKIYFAPKNGSHVLNIDTVGNKAETMTGPDLGDGEKYTAPGVLAANGKIYFAPFSGALQVLSINPEANIVQTLGPEMKGDNKYSAPGVMAPNGKICFAPSGPQQVLSIDPEEETAETLGPKLEGGSNYMSAGVLARNGKIYFAPTSARQVLSVDPGCGIGSLTANTHRRLSVRNNVNLDFMACM